MARPVKAVTQAKRELRKQSIEYERQAANELRFTLSVMTAERNRLKRRVKLLEEQRDTLLRALRDAQPQEHHIHDGVSPAID